MLLCTKYLQEQPLCHINFSYVPIYTFLKILVQVERTTTMYFFFFFFNIIVILFVFFLIISKIFWRYKPPIYISEKIISKKSSVQEHFIFFFFLFSSSVPVSPNLLAYWHSCFSFLLWKKSKFMSVCWDQSPFQMALGYQVHKPVYCKEINFIVFMSSWTGK